MSYVSHVNEFNLAVLEKSVGRGGVNRPLDVLTVQRLLNGCVKHFEGKQLLLEDGFYGARSETQIKLFQRTVLQFQRPDALINVDKGTHRRLVELVDTAYIEEHRTHAAINQKKNIDLARFLKLYEKQFPSEKNTAALGTLLQKIMADPHIADVRWVAYMLATVKRECGATWKPIEEWGKGKRYAYGKEIEVLDPSTQQTRKNVYYGRGYVQLTWDYNYKKVGELLGVGDRLYLYPEDALKDDVAYKIMSLGMRKGIFANASLSQYLSGKKTDYVGARRIINGSDHAMEIAKMAVLFEALLHAAAAMQIFHIFNGKKYEHYV